MRYIQKSIPLHVQCYDIIKNKIIEGELKSGERLLEKDISEELGVSRSPVREALRMLQQERLVISTSDRGNIINPMTKEEMKEVYECSIAIEPYAANLAAEHFNEIDSTNLKRNLKIAEDLYYKKEFDSIVQVNTEFHDLILNKCRNSTLIAIVDRLRALTLLRRRAELEFFNKRTDSFLKEHKEILEALMNGNGEQAEICMRNHIKNDYKAFLALSSEH